MKIYYEGFKDSKDNLSNGKLDSLCPLMNLTEQLFGGASGTNIISLWMQASELEDELYKRITTIMEKNEFIINPVINADDPDINLKIWRLTLERGSTQKYMIIPFVISQHFVGVIIDIEHNAALYFDSIITSQNKNYRMNIC